MWLAPYIRKGQRSRSEFTVVAASAWSIGKRAYIPAGSAAKIVDAVTLLHSMEGEEKPQLGRRVVIYGGGDTALDAARAAKRLGAEEAIIVYRRNREKMPAQRRRCRGTRRSSCRMRSTTHTRSTSTTARAAASAPRNARAVRSRWFRR